MSERINRQDFVEPLIAENAKLKKALSRLIPWAGSLPDGPDWATAEAKARNRKMCEDAISAACNCFPENYNGFTDEDAEISSASHTAR